MKPTIDESKGKLIVFLLSSDDQFYYLLAPSAVSDETAEGVARTILEVLSFRHEKKGTATSLGPLDGLQRMLNSFAKMDGQVSAKDIVSALSELLIDVTFEQANKIVKEIGE